MTPLSPRERVGVRAGLVLLLLAATACGSKEESDPLLFPEGFRWGTATAGFQVDMGCPTLPASECEDPNSDWYAWVTDPSLQGDKNTHLSGDPLSMSPGHWELYDEDYRLAREVLHNDSLRVSIEWSRIFPTSTVGIEGYDALKAVAHAGNVAHYRRMFEAMAARGLKPLVTLNHYTLPAWIHDAVGCHQNLDTCERKGWVDRENTVREAAKYAGFVAREFGAHVDSWVTLNEPMAVVLPGYIFPSAERTNPPGVMFKSEAARTVMRALIEAHARMYDAVKANDDVAEVGIVYAMVPVRPKDETKAMDRAAAKNVYYLYNEAFLNAVIKGDFDEALDRKAVHREDLAGRMDFLGINYYTRATVEGTEGPSFPDLSPLTHFNPLAVEPWENYPRGLYEMALVAKAYGLPAMVTENGTANILDANGGLDYLVPHLTWLQRAIRDGADVRGYFYWSLMDNYEWNHGMNMRFGLIEVDPNDPQKKRVPRPAAEVYGRIAQANRVADDLMAQWPAPEAP